MKQRKRGQAKKSSPKHSLNLPDLDQSRSAVLSSLPSKESQRGYRHAIDEFIEWYCSEPRLSFNKAVVTRYRIHLESRQLAPNTINGRLAAVRRLAYEAADSGPAEPRPRCRNSPSQGCEVSWRSSGQLAHSDAGACVVPSARSQHAEGQTGSSLAWDSLGLRATT